MPKPIYVVLVERPGDAGSPFVFGPFDSHGLASDVRDRYLASEPKRVSRVLVRSFYAPEILLRVIVKATPPDARIVVRGRPDPRRASRSRRSR